MVKKISGDEFIKVKAARLAVVDFSATWCGPCKMLAPVLEEVSEKLAETAEFYNIDVDENAEIAEQFGVTNIPALVVLRNGEKVDMQVGFQPKTAIEKFIKDQV